MIRPTIISGKEANCAAKAVSKLPKMTRPLTTMVPQTEPKRSKNIPPTIGNIVLIIETDDDNTPYRVLSICRF